MPIQIDDTVRNSDWLRSETWDIKPPTLSRLFEVLRVKDGSTIAKRDALVNFLLLPAAEPMPQGLKNLVRTFLATTKIPQSVGSDVTEKTITPVSAEEIVVSFELPEELEDQLPVIPDGVDVIEVSDELEKILGFLRRALQVFRGKPGNWITSRGRRFFINAKDKRANSFLEKVLASDDVLDVKKPALIRTLVDDVDFNPNIVRTVTLKGGTKGIWRAGQKGKQEWRSYEVSKALGWDDLIPPVALRKAAPDVKLDAGAVQFLDPARKSGRINQLLPKFASFPKKANNNDLGRAATFDYLSGNIDRHEMNYLFAKGGRLKLIDHEGSFMSKLRIDSPTPKDQTIFEVLVGERIFKSFTRGVISSDLLFEAGRRKLPIKTFMKDVNAVNWNTLFKRLDIPKDVANTTRQRIRILNEAADAGWDWSQLKGTPISPTRRQNINNLPRVADLLDL